METPVYLIKSIEKPAVLSYLLAVVTSVTFKQPKQVLFPKLSKCMDEIPQAHEEEESHTDEEAGECTLVAQTKSVAITHSGVDCILCVYEDMILKKQPLEKVMPISLVMQCNKVEREMIS